MIDPFSQNVLLQGVAFMTGITSGAALAYLLYKDVFVVGYPRFFRIIVLGMSIFALSGLLIGLFLPQGIHGVHALSALVMAAGLYDLLVGEQQSAPVEAAFGEFGRAPNAVADTDDFESAFGGDLDADKDDD